ncbi:type I-C CRISPR-associated protein Cas8c/Csd1 [Cuneatibacter sp. NSJ-177]|uniref:type I-C CRISPR-associated protein Cas8c/Csd1 n=1 Tax=Cuneatibacter sp. NSJ-177 TaxID=2931401 RepID=UPI001FD39847|nr:type I-C CRISPR-associated protein Cas8c/Csd1 [Cuneatibacter sp. NSJ-177]MCJ7835370.1 type I-C CRISPR-associated protein Cas8c/Csd1 [Cuneatibacter sp. NSJ-177]
MILQALVSYYESLVEKGKLARPGWNLVKVSYALRIGEDGSLLQVVPLKQEVTRGKKQVFIPREMNLPAPFKRSVGINPNFLCDNSSYILGIDKKGKPERTRECFEACRAFHEKLLSGTDSPFAKGILAFFQNWNPDQAAEHPELSEVWEDIQDNANLTFQMDLTLASEDQEIRDAWQTYYDKAEEDSQQMPCLVTGRKAPAARLHPNLKGVRGAQSSGASLVSFNAASYESYGKEQGLNAPVSEYAAFAYGAALNYLLSHPGRVQMIGDTTVVSWAEDGDEVKQDLFMDFFAGAGEDTPMTENELTSLLSKLAEGKPIDWKGIEVEPFNRYYILGLAPNAARVSVRFFLQKDFQTLAKNLKEHYERIRIVRPAWDRWDDIPLDRLLFETVNPNARDKTPSPEMSGEVLRAILNGSNYPATFYSSTMLRIRAERQITRGKAAIIKAYLLKNYEEKYREVNMVGLNPDRMDVAYVLGRLFSVLEALQQNANPTINATIRDKYFSSACETPAMIYPVLIKLSENHLKKIRGNVSANVYFEKQITDLMGRIGTFPTHLNLEDQGNFLLGYYHQTQDRYTKKEDK